MFYSIALRPPLAQMFFGIGHFLRHFGENLDEILMIPNL